MEIRPGLIVARTLHILITGVAVVLLADKESKHCGRRHAEVNRSCVPLHGISTSALLLAGLKWMRHKIEYGRICLVEQNAWSYSSPNPSTSSDALIG